MVFLTTAHAQPLLHFCLSNAGWPAQQTGKRLQDHEHAKAWQLAICATATVTSYLQHTRWSTGWPGQSLSTLETQHLLLSDMLLYWHYILLSAIRHDMTFCNHRERSTSRATQTWAGRVSHSVFFSSTFPCTTNMKSQKVGNDPLLRDRSCSHAAAKQKTQSRVP